jgi:hypothetical protein
LAFPLAKLILLDDLKNENHGFEVYTSVVFRKILYNTKTKVMKTEFLQTEKLNIFLKKSLHRG